MNPRLFAFSLAIVALVSGCAPRSAEVDTDAARRAALEQATTLADQAVPLKNKGDNAKAYALFEQARAILEAAPGDNRAALASNLDDLASIQTRLGDFSTARTLYLRAQAQLQALGAGPGRRLFDGIADRLEILTALEKAEHLCTETPTYAPNEAALPYFPPPDDTKNTLGRELNPLLQGCLEGPKTEVKVRMLLTGNGRLLLAKVQGDLADKPAGKCIEQRVLQAAPGLATKLPKFAACFRTMSYPFIVASPQAWKDQTALHPN